LGFVALAARGTGFAVYYAVGADEDHFVGWPV